MVGGGPRRRELVGALRAPTVMIGCARRPPGGDGRFLWGFRVALSPRAGALLEPAVLVGCAGRPPPAARSRATAARHPTWGVTLAG